FFINFLVAFGLLSLPICSSAADSISALGRLEPQQGVRLVSAPLTPESISGAIVSEILVKSGEDVEQGQLLAIMETAALSRAHLNEAVAALELAEREAATKHAAAEEVCVNARVAAGESERRRALLQKGVAGEEEAELAAGRAESLAAACSSSRTAAHAAEASIPLAQAQIELREVQLQRSMIYAPVSGRILAIHAWPGEMAALDGLLEIGQVGSMYAIAEIYETDIGRVRVGQKAEISSGALGSVLTGTVEKIHQKVAKMDTIGTDPAALKDARIIEVEIRLDDSAAASSLTYLQVDIVISAD
ncbi:MAG TPA: efflux RND transporter periplasmic adaptor subunit, partial [Xanthomonadales bacterium]|nr:efflux RND transporter periplasmic adaptor subunit [Xanthomonadales bacterium]